VEFLHFRLFTIYMGRFYGGSLAEWRLK
jgi:hypothetical protein